MSTFKPVLKSKLDTVNRDEAEAKARKQDAEKLKRKREAALPEAVAQLNRLNDPLAIAKRSKLILPPPQVAERELEDVAKAGSVVNATGDPTAMLATAYDQTPSSLAAAPTRTPRMGDDSDALLREAAAQATMLSRDTPLRGGDSACLQTPGNVSSMTPRQSLASMPNTLGGTTPWTPSHITPSSRASGESQNAAA